LKTRRNTQGGSIGGSEYTDEAFSAFEAPGLIEAMQHSEDLAEGARLLRALGSALRPLGSRRRTHRSPHRRGRAVGAGLSLTL